MFTHFGYGFHVFSFCSDRTNFIINIKVQNYYTKHQQNEKT